MKKEQILVNHGVALKKALELFGDIDTYNTSLESFVKEIRKKIDSIRNCKEISDMASYHIEIEDLKNHAQCFGFLDLADILVLHEEKSKENDMFYITEHYEELEEELFHTIYLVEEYLEGSISKKKENLPKIEEESFQDKAILIVDDSSITTKFVQKIFHKRYHCLVAGNGQEALKFLESAEKYKIVAILLDLNMPMIDGYDVLDYLKTNKLFEKIPVSIITSDHSKETKMKLSSYDIAYILEKPFNERDVKGILEKMIV